MRPLCIHLQWLTSLIKYNEDNKSDDKSTVKEQHKSAVVVCGKG